jgi:hypothetical protein
MNYLWIHRYDQANIWSRNIRAYFLFHTFPATQLCIFYFVPSGLTALCRGFTITLRHITLDRNPLEEWSGRRSDFYLTTHNTYRRRDSNLQSQKSERPQTHALDRAAVLFLTFSFIFCLRLIFFGYNLQDSPFHTQRVSMLWPGAYQLPSCKEIFHKFAMLFHMLKYVNKFTCTIFEGVHLPVEEVRLSQVQWYK